MRAPLERVFDLARSVEAHLASAGDSGDVLVEGREGGLLEAGEVVTWKGGHLGEWQNLTARITQMDRPGFFEDEMVSGAFKSMRHRHVFKEDEGVTLMRDEFEFESPYGILGRVVNSLFLTAYLRRFLKERAERLKEMAESEEWQRILGGEK
ncbi:MAG: SRPBCC family protein [Verrucomicrobiota bacterium]